MSVHSDGDFVKKTNLHSPKLRQVEECTCVCNFTSSFNGSSEGKEHV